MLQGYLAISNVFLIQKLSGNIYFVYLNCQVKAGQENLSLRDYPNIVKNSFQAICTLYRPNCQVKTLDRAKT